MGKRKKKKQRMDLQQNANTQELNTENPDLQEADTRELTAETEDAEDTSVLDELEAYLDEIEAEGVKLVEAEDEAEERFRGSASVNGSETKKKIERTEVVSTIIGVLIGILIIAIIVVFYLLIKQAVTGKNGTLSGSSETEVVTEAVTEVVTAGDSVNKEEDEAAMTEVVSEEVKETAEEATVKEATTQKENETVESVFAGINQDYEGNVRVEKKLKAITEEVEWVKAHPELYPEDEYEKAKKNPELLHFLYKYGMKKYLDQKNIILGKDDLRDDSVCIYQWDDRWGYHPYGSSVVAITGCGPTCMAMVVGTLLNDMTVTPNQLADFAMANDLYSYGAGTKWEFMERVAEEYHISCVGIYYDKESLLENLEDGKVIVCVVGEGHFTTDGHFIVITGEKNGKLIVHDPNNYENTHTLWKYEDIKDELGGAWAFSAD